MSYFKAFGHTCGLKIDEDFKNYLNDRPLFHRFLINWTSIDVKSEPTTQYFSSHAAVVKGTKHHLDNHPMTIHPFSRFKFIWEMIMASMFLTGLIYVPLQYLDYLDDDDESIGNLMIIKSVKLTCIVDIILRFFCGYVDEKKFVIILDKKLIARRYLSGFFIVDLIINVPFFYGFYVNQDIEMLHFIKLCTLFRILRTSTFIIYCHRALRRFHVGDKYLDIFEILIYWLVAIHWTACLHLIPGLILSRFNMYVKVNAWYEQHTFLDHDDFHKYLILMFKSVKTMMSLGHLDKLEPRENFDIYYSMALTIGGRLGVLATFAYIWVMMQGMMSSRLRYHHMVVQLKKYTLSHRLSPNMRTKLKRNYDYRFRKRYFNEQDILDTVSLPLSQQIMIHNTHKLILNSPFFENLPVHLILQIIAALTVELFMENDTIYVVGEIGTSVHFITYGSVAFYSSSGKEIHHFTDGDYFGEITFVSDVDYRFCKAIALETTECYKLDKDDFQRLVAAYPDLMSKVEFLALRRIDRVLTSEDCDVHRLRDSYMSLNEPRFSAT